MQFFFTLKATLVAACVLMPPASATRAGQQWRTQPVDPPSPYIRPVDETQTCPGPQSNLTIKIHNNQPRPLFFYITGRDPHTSNFVVLRRQNSCTTWFTKPEYTNTSSIMPFYFIDTTDDNSGFHSTVEVNGSVSFHLPSYTSSARLYVAQDKLRFGTNIGGHNVGLVEPSSTNNGQPEYNIPWQFIEFTYGQGNFVLNPSYVDFASMSLNLTATSRTSIQMVPGLGVDALDKICSQLNNQTAKDNQSWAHMCLTDEDGKNLRAISPSQYLSLHPDDKISTYYEGYVDKVWEKYSDQNLTINTQDDGSGTKVDDGRRFTCQVKPEDQKLWCSGDGVDIGTYSFRKPSTPEIMGCVQGSLGASSQDMSPFTVTDGNQSLIVPRLCAAFTRSTLLLENGNVQPNIKITASQYYTDPITNHYSRIVHENLEGGMGYAFPYDDTNPVSTSSDNRTSNAGGLIEDADPQLLEITVR